MTAQVRNCPECARPVPGPDTKLCPYCGYPLLLDRPVAGQPVARHGVARKPEQPAETGFAGPPVIGSGQPLPPGMRYQGPQRVRTPGPRCPSCRHGNAQHRKRCEVCGAELWPGAAFPARWMPRPPPAAAAPPRRRNRWQIALLVGIPVAAMLTVWALAFWL